jgi:hypothetical protein
MPEPIKPTGFIVNGLIACALSLVIWYGTHSLWGWAMLAIPGGGLILAGWCVALKD